MPERIFISELSWTLLLPLSEGIWRDVRKKQPKTVYYSHVLSAVVFPETYLSQVFHHVHLTYLNTSSIIIVNNNYSYSCFFLSLNPLEKITWCGVSRCTTVWSECVPLLRDFVNKTNQHWGSLWSDYLQNNVDSFMVTDDTPCLFYRTRNKIYYFTWP